MQRKACLVFHRLLVTAAGILLAGVMTTLVGCEGHQEETTDNRETPGEEASDTEGTLGSEEPTSEQEATIERMIWDTFGGGELKFTVVKAGADYRIDVTSHEFRPVAQTIMLTSGDADVYDLVQSIFDGTRDLSNDVLVPDPDKPTGTWTTITLVLSNRQQNAFADIYQEYGLRALYSFVTDRIVE